MKILSLQVFFMVATIFVSGCAVLEEDPYKEPPQDWNTRSNHPDVLRAIGFDKAEDITLYAREKNADRLRLDDGVKASGNSSMQMIIPSKTGENPSGVWRINFSDYPFEVQFGENQEFFIQWRQRFDSFLLEHRFERANGFKQVIIGEGDRPDENEARSCTDLEIVVENTRYRGYPQMYHSCHHYKAYRLERFVDYAPDEWMTFQIQVKLGPLGEDWDSASGQEMHGYTQSVIKMWDAREGEKSRLTHDLRGLVLRTGYDQAPDARYGKIWLLPHMSEKDPSEEHPETYTWFDELIISRSRIADPK